MKSNKDDKNMHLCGPEREYENFRLIYITK